MPVAARAKLSGKSEQSNSEHSMTNRSKHAGLGIALGAALGAVFGLLAGNMGVWLVIGVAIGVLIGASFRRKPADCPQCAQIHRAHELGNPRQQASS